MTWFNDVFVPAAGTYAVIVIGAAIVAAVFHDAKQATSALKVMRRRIRFHRGQVRADGEPLTPAELEAIAVIERRFRRWTPDREYEQQQEDWF